jgi:hypothetical protein
MVAKGGSSKKKTNKKKKGGSNKKKTGSGGGTQEAAAAASSESLAASSSAARMIPKGSVDAVLSVFFSLFDDKDDEESNASGASNGGSDADDMSPGRSVSLLILQSVIRTLSDAPALSSSSSGGSGSGRGRGSSSGGGGGGGEQPNQLAVLSLRKGLVERLPAMGTCLEAVTDRIVEAVADKPVATTAAVTASGGSDGKSKAVVLLEQARVLVTVAAFCCNVTFRGASSSSSSSSSSSQTASVGVVTVTGLPPTPLLLSSGLLRTALKLGAVLTAFDYKKTEDVDGDDEDDGGEGAEAKADTERKRAAVGARGASVAAARASVVGLVAALVAHGDTIADFAVRAPSTAKILAALSPGSAGAAAAPTTEVLVLCLFLSVGCQSLPTGGSRLKQQPQTTKTSTADGSFKLSGETVHGLTASAFVNLLSDDDKGGGGGGSSTPVASAASSVSQAAAVLAWLAPMPPRVLDRIRKWMRGAEGGWFVNWTESVAASLQPMPTPTPMPTPPDSATTPVPPVRPVNESSQPGNNSNATNDDGDHHRDDGDRPPEKAGRARGRRKREAGILQDARRVLKLLGEKEAGGNKTD